MENQFIRAKSRENKAIRLQQIMNVTDQLFQKHTYHEISLSVISNLAGFARGGLYKYVSSKEELFLLLYLEKQEEMLQDILAQMRGRKVTITLLADVMSSTLYRHFDFLKYHQIQNAIVETNVSIEKLAEFKKNSLQQRRELFELMMEACHTDEKQVYDAYLSILAHSVYLRDRMNCADSFVKAMEIAGLEIVPVKFIENLCCFIRMYLTHCVTGPKS